MYEDIEVASVVVSLDFGSTFDLEYLHANIDAKETEYSPEQNHWLKTWFEPEDTYVSFYQSGMAMIAGVGSVSEARDIAEKVTESVQEVVDVGEPEYEVQNIVAKYSLDSAVPLERLALSLGYENVEYEPEQFPALIYRENGAVFLIFSSGELICVGLTDLGRIRESIQKFVEETMSQFL
jgi:transcription initiation factor TFIID TATA-box-binding protein